MNVHPIVGMTIPSQTVYDNDPYSYGDGNNTKTYYMEYHSGLQTPTPGHVWSQEGG